LIEECPANNEITSSEEEFFDAKNKKNSIIEKSIFAFCFWMNFRYESYLKIVDKLKVNPRVS